MNPRFCSVALFMLLACTRAGAIERIHFTAAELTYGNVVLETVDATMTLRRPERALATLSAGRVVLPESFARQTGPVQLKALRCDDLVIKEPRIACPRLSMLIDARKLPMIAFDGLFEQRTDVGSLRFKGAGPEFAGQRLDIDFLRERGSNTIALRLPATPLATLLPLFAPWLSQPAESGLTGDAALAVDIAMRRGSNQALVDAHLAGVGFQNEASTWIGEQLDFDLQADIDLTAEPLAWRARLSGDAGQLLAGPVYLDLGRNPLEASASGEFDGQRVVIREFRSDQRDLARASGHAELVLAPFSVHSARVELESLQFPDAYASFLQVMLTTTPFNKLETRGQVSGAVTIAEGLPTAADVIVDDFSFSDASRDLVVTGVNANLHWTAGETGPPRPSWLKWDSARGWGVNGAQSRVDFAMHDRSFQLLEQARLPLFDGALVIQRLAVENAGRPDMAGEFAAVIEPISLPLVARALGLPEFAGQISGSIPGLRYRDQVLQLEGEIEAQAFDGQIIAHNLSIGEPLGDFPRLHADITARRLDLNLITQVFDFGNVTGRMDVDATGLETFGRRVTAMDFSVRNSPGDRTKRRISQRAVENLTNVGGGGGIGSALQNGALRFFDTFVYDQIGLSCRLRDDVCLMGGVGRAPDNGFYIVKGWGVPRIDIIGRNERVDWPRLVSQIGQALNNSGAIVVN